MSRQPPFSLPPWCDRTRPNNVVAVAIFSVMWLRKVAADVAAGAVISILTPSNVFRDEATLQSMPTYLSPLSSSCLSFVLTRSVVVRESDRGCCGVCAGVCRHISGYYCPSMPTGTYQAIALPCRLVHVEVALHVALLYVCLPMSGGTCWGYCPPSTSAGLTDFRRRSTCSSRVESGVRSTPTILYTSTQPRESPSKR